ncbi:MAG: plastocyanin/azurin family copper-binding protein [Alphaproteobacteria bacterium]|jgi:plastocyanin|nr:plastocyanin/azurin family copper-binding protein [Alphaproteobacteria bacterium]MDP6591299.1 plastocyanin/azurin family copper-binding protein [Alphaproteobacteria bacterium]MDP6818284.1 plastocyanin/azurin family copper-binding protein [Alphaproteobacteria bacterium]|tara:strand:+ start:747 stop:1109 length:363 start_codon:yes stop_codon:yes gene_type:complete
MINKPAKETNIRLPVAALICVLLLLPLAAAGAHAGSEHVISQKGKKFSPGQIDIKVGDTLTFINDDKRRHNIYSKTPGQTFNIRKQSPGARDSITFDDSGTVEVRCAIHPKMRLVVNISE